MHCLVPENMRARKFSYNMVIIACFHSFCTDFIFFISNKLGVVCLMLTLCGMLEVDKLIVNTFMRLISFLYLTN